MIRAMAESVDSENAHRHYVGLMRVQQLHESRASRPPGSEKDRELFDQRSVYF